MKVKFTSDQPLATAWHFELDQSPIIIGRDADIDIQVVDRWTSRRHCKIDLMDGQLVVRDLDSRHGTLVNGSWVNRNPTSSSALMPGDRLTVGLTTFQVTYRRRCRTRLFIR